MARGLLERLALNSRAASVDTPESVLEHVQFLLNTRQGSSKLDAHFGVPDFTDILHSLPGGTNVLRIMLEECIRRHEPRLANVRMVPITGEDHALVLRFEVQAVLRSGSAIRFSTEVSRGGRVRVR